MHNYQNFSRAKETAFRTWFISTLLLLILTGTAYAQQSYERSKLKPDQTSVIDSLYTRALEDTLILYEQLKPAFKFLQISYSFKNAETESLRSENRGLYEMQGVQKVEFDAEIKREKQKGKENTWKGFWKGVGVGALIMGLATALK